MKRIFLTSERKISRKFIEGLLSLLIEKRMSKTKIFYSYLSTVIALIFSSNFSEIMSLVLGHFLNTIIDYLFLRTLTLIDCRIYVLKSSKYQRKYLNFWISIVLLACKWIWLGEQINLAWMFSTLIQEMPWLMSFICGTIFDLVYFLNRCTGDMECLELNQHLPSTFRSNLSFSLWESQLCWPEYYLLLRF